MFVGRGFLENGKKEGLWYYFYETGELKNEIEYKNGVENGILKLFHENGNIAVICKRVNGQPVGLWQEYYENGKPQKEGEYIDNEYFPINFGDKEGNQLLKDETGMKIAEFGSETLFDVYEQYLKMESSLKSSK